LLFFTIVDYRTKRMGLFSRKNKKNAAAEAPAPAAPEQAPAESAAPAAAPANQAGDMFR